MAGQDGTDAGSVDLEAMINTFLADSSVASLQLPQSLTADERKEARRLVDQHPQLKCESYGFGEERRLHVFKKVDQGFRIKNTFIDDWEGAEREAPAFRSMPAGSMPENLLERTLQRCGLGGRSPEVLAPTQEVPESSPSHMCSAVELPPLPEGFQVRNTFIHIESVPTVERIVQSMPHGMFRQCLEAELSAQSPPGPAAVAPKASAPVPATPAPSGPPTGLPSDDMALLPGTEVTIQNLVKLPDFNGLLGIVQSFDAESGRYDVLLDGPAGQCGWRWVKVKGENCRPRMPPPPRNAPTLSMVDDSEEGSNSIPPTPNCYEDYSASATKLKLNALV